MSWIDAALWGLFGSFAVEGMDLYTAVRRHGRWPWRVNGPREVGMLGYVVAELIRLIIGGGLASAAAVSGQLTSAVWALAVGLAAPLILERLAVIVDSVLLSRRAPGVGVGVDGAVTLPDPVHETQVDKDQSTALSIPQKHNADQAANVLGEREGQLPERPRG